MRPADRFWLFIFSNRNIFGSVLALLGLLAFFLGLIGAFWIVIVLGLYGIGFLAWPKNPVRLTMQGTLSDEEIVNGLRSLRSRIRKKVLPETLAKVDAIIQLVRELLPRVSQAPQDRHILSQTATDYLPAMLEHYLNLPPTFARFHRLKDGRTAREILLDQLTVLEEQLNEIAGNIAVGDTDKLRAHGRFLESKFGKDTTWSLERSKREPPSG